MSLLIYLISQVVFHIKKGQAFYVTLLNGAVDSSSIAMLIVKVRYQNGQQKFSFLFSLSNLHFSGMQWSRIGFAFMIIFISLLSVFLDEMVVCNC